MAETPTPKSTYDLAKRDIEANEIVACHWGRLTRGCYDYYLRWRNVDSSIDCYCSATFDCIWPVARDTNVDIVNTEVGDETPRSKTFCDVHRGAEPSISVILKPQCRRSDRLSIW